MATLNTIEPNDIGRRVRLTTARGVIVGDLGDFAVHTDWVTSRALDGTGWERVPTGRSVEVEVGDWSGRLPIDTAVEWV